MYTSNTMLSKLQVLQNKAIRIIIRQKARTNVREHERSLGLLPLSCRRKLRTIQFVYTLSFDSNLIDTQHSTLKTRTQDANRRQYWLYRPNKSRIIKSVSYQVRYIWNNLPTHLHMMPNRHLLKIALLSSDSRYLLNEE